MPAEAADHARTIYVAPWRVDVVRRAGFARLVADAEVARLTTRALEACAAPAPASVTFVLTDDAELADLNAEHMGLAGPTDVLSFPMLPPERFGGSGSGSTTHSPGVAGRIRRIHIGDVAISVERAIEQAGSGRGGQTGDRRWSASDELRLLVVHGTLHLAGWDHAEPAEEAAMRALENRLLQASSGRPALRAARGRA